MNDNPHSTDDYTAAKNLIDKKITLGYFWFHEGAIANAKKLSLRLLRRGQILEAISLMAEVHGRATAHLDDLLLSVDNRNWLWQKWRRKSTRAFWFYENLRRTLLFFGAL